MPSEFPSSVISVTFSGGRGHCARCFLKQFGSFRPAQPGGDPAFSFATINPGRDFSSTSSEGEFQRSPRRQPLTCWLLTPAPSPPSLTDQDSLTPVVLPPLFPSFPFSFFPCPWPAGRERVHGLNANPRRVCPILLSSRNVRRSLAPPFVFEKTRPSPPLILWRGTSQSEELCRFYPVLSP